MATELLHPISSDLRLARELADLADSVSLPRFRGRDFGVDLKEDRTHVTDADRAVEQAVRERLAEARPSDSFFGEESGRSGESRQSRTVAARPIAAVAQSACAPQRSISRPKTTGAKACATRPGALMTPCRRP